MKRPHPDITPASAARLSPAGRNDPPARPFKDALHVAQALEISKALSFDDIEHVFCGALGYIEHVVHELSHAALLGLEPCRLVTARIAVALEGLSPCFQVDNEARAFAVEAKVLGRMGLFYEESSDPDEKPEDCLEWADLLTAASAQGVADGHVLFLYDEYLSEDSCAVDKVLNWVRMGAACISERESCSDDAAGAQ